MKISGTLQMAALVLVLGQTTGHSQTYYYSGPVSGYTEVDLSPQGLGYGGFNANFGTLSETLYYNAAAQSLEQTGTITLNPSSGSFSIEGSILDPGSGSASLAVGNNGGFSFDDTSYSSGGGSLSFIWYLLVPVSGSGTYQGQPFSGSWNLDLPLVTTIENLTPASLAFSQVMSEAAQPANAGPGLGLLDGVSDGTYYSSWDVGETVASAVPEPGSFSLLVLGLPALAFLRRRREPPCSKARDALFPAPGANRR